LTADLKVVIIALILALDVFAVSMGVGTRDIPLRLKVRIGLVFAFAEMTMVSLGALLGFAAGRLLGDFAGYIGFVALIGLGIYLIKESRAEFSEAARLDLSQGWGLMLAALSISLDSLGIGFTILYIGVPMPISLVIIGIVSVCSTALGLALGRRIGAVAESHAALLGGVLLLLTGIVFTVLKALHIG
jgi:manganese efflux pump family protein